MRALSKAPLSVQRKVMSTAQKRIDQIAAGKGIFDYVKIFGHKVTNPETLWGNAIDSWGNREALGLTAELIENTGKTTWFITKNIPLANKITGPKLGRSFRIKDMALVTFVIYNIYQEQVNIHKVSSGVNTLALSSPYAEIETFPLTDKAEDYFIRFLNTYTDDKNRLSIASPCKADLKVVKMKCTCPQNPNLYHWDFGGGTVDVNPGTITTINDPTEEEEKEIRYMLEANKYGLKMDTLDIVKDHVDYTNAVKSCRPFTRGEKATKIKDYYTVATFSPGLEASLTYLFLLNDYMKDWITTGKGEYTSMKEIVSQTDETPPVDIYSKYTKTDFDCINVEIQKDKNYDANYNYCYPAYPLSQRVKKTVFWTGIGIDIATAIIVPAVVVPVAAVVGFVDSTTESIITEIWQKWPKSSDTVQDIN